jgi:riboflavin kinase/FMN adenylyltransferase
VLEVHLFEFDGDLYGMDIEVEFLRFVRGEKKFDSLDDLCAQIERDIAEVRV